MTKILGRKKLKDILDNNPITQEIFAEKAYYTPRGFQDILYVNKKLDHAEQNRLVDVIIQLDKDTDYINEPTLYFDLEMHRDYNQSVLDVVKKWIETEDICRLYEYWENFDNIYRLIDEEEVVFLMRCKKLVSINSKTDLRAELLSYLQSFFYSVASVQKALSTISIFHNRENNIKKYNANHKLSQKKYRERLEKEFSRSLYEEVEPKKGRLIHRHLWFIFDMDDTDWDLLIAYTLVSVNDENDEILKRVIEKWESLLMRACET